MVAVISLEHLALTSFIICHLRQVLDFSSRVNACNSFLEIVTLLLEILIAGYKKKCCTP